MHLVAGLAIVIDGFSSDSRCEVAWRGAYKVRNVGYGLKGQVGICLVPCMLAESLKFKRELDM